MVRMVNSGTEATLSAIRVARGATGRARIVKFEGCYHGHGDSFLVKAGSGVMTLGLPNSPGVPAALADLTLTLPYNDFDAATRLFDEAGDEIAGLIIEPIVGNANCILPRDGYPAASARAVHAARHRADLRRGDDRLPRRARRRAGSATASRPTSRTFGKIIGGGMPVGAYGGRRELMEQIAPSGPIYQAGTLSGNPVAMAAGLATLELIQAPGFHDALERSTHALCDGLEAAAREAGVAFTTTRGAAACSACSSATGRWRPSRMRRHRDTARFNRFFHAMLERGVYLAPSAFEAGFMSSAHGAAEIEHTLEAAQSRVRHAVNETTPSTA